VSVAPATSLRAVARPSLTWFFALALLALGCDRMRDVKRCRVLARTVNASFDAIEKEVARGPKDASYQAIGKEYDALAKSLEGFDGGTPELGRAVNELAALSRNAARHANGLEEAKKGDNKQTANVLTHELERQAKQEKVIAGRIDEECRPK
jgi:hypothetical protein